MMEASLRTRETGMEDCQTDQCKLPKKHEGLCDLLPTVLVEYTNWKGNRRKRRIAPTGMVVHQATEWHKLPEWLFEVIDCEDGKQKLFAISGVTTSRDSLVGAIQLRWFHG